MARKRVNKKAERVKKIFELANDVLRDPDLVSKEPKK